MTRGVFAVQRRFPGLRAFPLFASTSPSITVPSKLSKLGWYWHRLRAMGPGEVALRLQKKAYQRADKNFSRKFSLSLDSVSSYPNFDSKSKAPKELLDGLRSSVDAILRGEWLAFGHLPIKVDAAPNWHRDYLVGKDLRSSKSAFNLDHRAQPDGADIKVIWEPSRWYQLVRLAMAAWLLDDAKTRDKCIEWLHDWAKNNPPFTGLNWTSGLEVGLRLVQYTWIDAFLACAGVPNKTLHELREEILPPHVWYAWRYKSFGSSANNHLLGEIAGLIVAVARWPQLAEISAPLKNLGALLEREILLQFAKDGGNNEQALSYHLFSWEFCSHSQYALACSGLGIAREASLRLIDAREFYCQVKPEQDVWDFGDSDNAYVLPLFADERNAPAEWWRLFADFKTSPALGFFCDDVGPIRQLPKAEWFLYEDSGYAILRSDDWFLRFDLSPLGYLSMAPHGHLDALHISVWFRHVPVIIDPGTGAYYADKTVRNYFADWAAHNSPHLRTPPQPHPKRFGTFLWGGHHKRPTVRLNSPQEVTGELELPYGRAIRTVTYLPASNSIRITDTFQHAAKTGPVTTRWKFAPDFSIKHLSPNEFSLSSAKCFVRLTASADWTGSRIFNPPDELRGQTATTMAALGSVPLQALVSPAFRSLAVAPYLALEGSSEGPFSLTISAA
jgi:hypothetical protein